MHFLGRELVIRGAEAPVKFPGAFTKTELVNSQRNIWKYDPKAPTNKINGEKDLLAGLRTLIVKVRLSRSI